MCEFLLIEAIYDKNNNIFMMKKRAGSFIAVKKLDKIVFDRKHSKKKNGEVLCNSKKTRSVNYVNVVQE